MSAGETIEFNDMYNNEKPYVADGKTRERLEQSMKQVLKEGGNNMRYSDEYLDTVRHILARAAMEDQNGTKQINAQTE